MAGYVKCLNDNVYKVQDCENEDKPGKIIIGQHRVFVRGEVYKMLRSETYGFYHVKLNDGTEESGFKWRFSEPMGVLQSKIYLATNKKV